MQPSKSTVPNTRSAATARMRRGKLTRETAAIVPCTSAIIVARVSAAAQTTATAPANIFPITMRLPGYSDWPKRYCLGLVAPASRRQPREYCAFKHCAGETPALPRTHGWLYRRPFLFQTLNRREKRGLFNARPIVGHQDRIAGIGGIIFHAGRL